MLYAGSCSHNRVVYLWAESVNSNIGFDAVSIDKSCQLLSSGWEDFKAHHINRTNVVLMGPCTPKTIQGRFYLVTNAATPYAKGIDGIWYTPAAKT